MITADLVTDEQIATLRDDLSTPVRTRILCKIALGEAATYLHGDIARDARERVAELLNNGTEKTS